MTLAMGRVENPTLTSATIAPPSNTAHALTVPGPFRRAAALVGDLFGTMAVVLSIPLVILAIGIPIALFVRLLLWIGGLR